MKRADRKTKVEAVYKAGDKLAIDEHQCCLAWLRLMRGLEHMSEPEARPPRFNRLLRAIWVAATNEETDQPKQRMHRTRTPCPNCGQVHAGGCGGIK